MTVDPGDLRYLRSLPKPDREKVHYLWVERGYDLRRALDLYDSGYLDAHIRFGYDYPSAGRRARHGCAWGMLAAIGYLVIWLLFVFY